MKFRGDRVMRSKSILLLATVVVMLPTELVFADLLYGTTGLDHSLFRIDPYTGSSELVGDAGQSLVGLAYNSNDGFLYGTTGLDHSLFRIDPYTTDFELVGDAGYNIDGLAYVPEPSTLLLLGLGVVILRRK